MSDEKKTMTVTYAGKRHFDARAGMSSPRAIGILRGATYIGVSHEEPDPPDWKVAHPLTECAVWLRIGGADENGSAITAGLAREVAAALLAMADLADQWNGNEGDA